jgi:hypothetical protein
MSKVCLGVLTLDFGRLTLDFRIARVAQLTERWSYKPEAEGLNPSLGTIRQTIFHISFPFLIFHSAFASLIFQMLIRAMHLFPESALKNEFSKMKNEN